MSSTALSAADRLSHARGNLTLYTERLERLNSFKPDSIPDVKAFVETEAPYYPAYEHYGEKVYSDSSVFWRTATYFPFFSEFSTYTELGKDAAELDMSKFRVFLAADIKEELQLIDAKIQRARSTIDRLTQ